MVWVDAFVKSFDMDGECFVPFVEFVCRFHKGRYKAVVESRNDVLLRCKSLTGHMGGQPFGCCCYWKQRWQRLMHFVPFC